MTVDAIKRKISRLFHTFCVEVEVLRETFNEFNEPASSVLVATVKGRFYKRKGGSVFVSVSEKGIFKPKVTDGFVTACDENGLLVKEGDFFILKGESYKVVCVSNVYDAYLDFAIVKEE